MDYTVDTLVTDIRTTGSVPSAQTRFDDDSIINIMTRIMRTKVVPMMMTMREEYFVEYTDYSITQGNLTGYAIPTNAVGMKLRAVCLVNNSGQLNMTQLPRLSLEQISGYYFGQVVPFGFYIQNNNVILWPVNQTTPANTIRLYYIARTNKLTASTNCRQILSITGNDVTLADVPGAWTTATMLNAIDPLPGFNTQASSIDITNISGDTLTLDDASALEEDDWLAEDGYSPIAQIPVEAHQLLVQETALEILKSLGDTEGYNKLMIEKKELTSFIMSTINPRSDGNPKKAISAGNGIADWCGFRSRGT